MARLGRALTTPPAPGFSCLLGVINCVLPEGGTPRLEEAQMPQILRAMALILVALGMIIFGSFVLSAYESTILTSIPPQVASTP
jgi:hypothetical protein